MTAGAPLLEIDRLVIGGADGTVPIVDDLNLTIERAAALGIAGESGCGKSTLLLAMMGIVKPGLHHRAGSCRFDGLDLLDSDDRALEKLRGGRVALIPQNAGTALTPNIRIGDQIGEVLALHTDLAGSALQDRVVELLRQVRLPTPERLRRRFPHELSGGQLQRVGIAMALAGEPELLLLDEPTTGLDVTTQLGILHLLADLRRERNVAMICVSHDLGVIATLSDRVAIMYSGRIIEAGPTAQLLRQPAHPYSRALLASIPRISTARIPLSIDGRPPTPQQHLPGCRFAPRCGHAAEDCLSGAPELVSADGENWVACRHPLAGTVDFALDGKDGAGRGIAPTLPQIAIDDLSVTYQRRGILDALLPRPPGKLAVDHLSLVLRKGEVLGLVGESGSGKSTILKAISGLWPVLSGKATFGAGTDLSAPVGGRDRTTLRAIQLIFQNPDASLNPRHSVREILAQPLRLYFNLSAGEIGQRAALLLKDVKLDASYLDRFPGDLSGGERQRVAIARAFAAEPEVILCDEITSALDVSVQASILRLIRDLAIERQVACLFVSHDLAVVQALAHRVAVLYRGHLVEIGPARAVCTAPSHPYTRALLAAVLEPGGGGVLSDIRPLRDEDDRESHGCPYAGRCAGRLEKCSTEAPSWLAGADGHGASCHLLAAD